MDSIGRATVCKTSFRLTMCSLLATAALSPALAQEIPVGPASQDIASPDLLQTGVDDSQLQPGEFLWLPAADHPAGATLMIIVNLAAQRAYVYRDGAPIAISTVSTGRPGRETPIGAFEILQKERMHHSNLYDSAPMPFMQRLTWTGLSLHAGHLPGYPASHGCIRLPEKFAEQLYQLTEPGEFVVISDNGSADALARAGLDSQLHLFANTASTLDRVVGAVEPGATAGAEHFDGLTELEGADPDAVAGYSH